MGKVSLLTIFLLALNQSLQAPRDDIPGSTALDNFPLVDGHNDLPYNLYSILRNQIYDFGLENDLTQHPSFGTNVCSSCFTDIPRLRQGKVGAQFWVAYVGCNPNDYNTIVSRSFEQVDVIRRMVNKYSDDMEFVTTADGIEQAFQNNKIASLIGLEGGHSIDSRVSILRLFYDLGVRYMTLTHSCNIPWADASPVDASAEGPVLNLTEFGKDIVREMNRLGMMVDLSHVSHNVMADAIDTSLAPVIFSHSSAHTVYAHHRNVQDDILLKVRDNGGVVMVNFYSGFVGQGRVTINHVVDHINHIVNITGVDHVGIGADYDGVDSVPEGLEDVSKYPDLFDLLKVLDPERWTIENLEKLAGRNLVRVFKEVERVRDELAARLPSERVIDVDPRPPSPAPPATPTTPTPPEENGNGSALIFLGVTTIVMLTQVVLFF